MRIHVFMMVIEEDLARSFIRLLNIATSIVFSVLYIFLRIIVYYAY